MVELRSDEASQSGPVRPALSRGCHALAPRVHRDQIAIARRPPTQPPARSFTGGFRTTAAVQAEASRWAVIRNPSHQPTSRSLLPGREAAPATQMTGQIAPLKDRWRLL